VITDKQVFDVEFSELLSRIVASSVVKRSRSVTGLDELACEHLQFSHPVVVSVRFDRSCSVSFGASYTVPIPKCDGRTRAFTVDDFRGISISPIISKLFEMAVQHCVSKNTPMFLAITRESIAGFS